MLMGVGHVLLPPAGGPKSMVLGMLSRNEGRSIAGRALIETPCYGWPVGCHYRIRPFNIPTAC